MLYVMCPATVDHIRVFWQFRRALNVKQMAVSKVLFRQYIELQALEHLAYDQVIYDALLAA